MITVLMVLAALSVAAAMYAFIQMGVLAKKNADLQMQIGRVHADNQSLREANAIARGYLYQMTAIDMPGTDGAVRALDRMDQLTKETT